jgi:hypothetical protein
MKALLAPALLLSAFAGCAQQREIAYNAPSRLFNPGIRTATGQPHPGWTPALVERMRREDLNPVLTPMDRNLEQPLDWREIEAREIDYKARQLSHEHNHR